MYSVVTQFLVVDDDRRTRELMISKLQSLGHAAFGAATGEEALQLVETKPIDIVVGNALMSKSDGIEIITVLCDRYPKMPVIAVAASSTHANLFLNLARQYPAKWVLT